MVFYNDVKNEREKEEREKKLLQKINLLKRKQKCNQYFVENYKQKNFASDE